MRLGYSRPLGGAQPTAGGGGVPTGGSVVAASSKRTCSRTLYHLWKCRRRQNPWQTVWMAHGLCEVTKIRRRRGTNVQGWGRRDCINVNLALVPHLLLRTSCHLATAMMLNVSKIRLKWAEYKHVNVINIIKQQNKLKGCIWRPDGPAVVHVYFPTSSSDLTRIN